MSAAPFSLHAPLTELEETQYLLKFEPAEAIVRMFNLANDTHYPLDGFTISPPTVIDGSLVEVTLTRRCSPVSPDIEVTPLEATFRFHRVDLTRFIGDKLEGWRPPIPSSTQVILDTITSRVGQDFWLDDIVLEDIARSNAAPYILKAKQESLRWSGTCSLTLLNLTELSSYLGGQFSEGLPAMDNAQIVFGYHDSVVSLNATPAFGALAGFTFDLIDTLNGLPVEERTFGDFNASGGAGALLDELIPLLLLTALPPLERFEDITDLSDIFSGWLGQETPAPFNLKGSVYEGTVPTPDRLMSNPLLTESFKITLGERCTNFAAGTSLYLPYDPESLNVYIFRSENGGFDPNRLTRSGIVSLTDASAWAPFLNTLTLGNVITQWLSNGTPKGADIHDSGFELELDGRQWWCAPTEALLPGVGIYSGNNLYGSVVQYNGQKRQRDIEPVTQGLDRVCVISLDPTYCATYRGNMSIYYKSVIGLPLELPRGTVGSQYLFDIPPVGGVGPYTTTLLSGSLPPGISLISPNANFKLNGLPTVAGNYPFSIEIEDSVGTKVVFSFTLNVSAVVQTLAISGTYLPGKVGEAYTSFVNLSGGIAPYLNPRVVANTLPGTMAIAIVGNGLRLMGQWPTDGTFDYSFAVDSTDGQTVSTTQRIVIAPGA